MLPPVSSRKVTCFWLENLDVRLAAEFQLRVQGSLVLSSPRLLSSLLTTASAPGGVIRKINPAEPTTCARPEPPTSPKHWTRSTSHYIPPATRFHTTYSLPFSVQPQASKFPMSIFFDRHRPSVSAARCHAANAWQCLSY